jgi:hypothetical protein
MTVCCKFDGSITVHQETYIVMLVLLVRKACAWYAIIVSTNEMEKLPLISNQPPTTR